MFVKYFYLVRHGETILNVQRRRQDEKGGLSEKGILEVEDLGKRMLHMKIQKIFVSPYERTLETATIVNKYLKITEKDYIITPLLAERRNPTIIVGKHYDDPIAKAFIDKMDKSIHDPNLRIYDEENFQDLKDRALRAQKFLIQNGKKYNACFTHGIFLKMFLSTLLYGKKLSVKDYIQMNMYNPADNAGVTLVKYSPLKKFTAPFKKFIDLLLADPKTEEEKGDEENEKEKAKIDKYSPWEILAYNDYTRDGFKKLSI